MPELILDTKATITKNEPYVSRIKFVLRFAQDSMDDSEQSEESRTATYIGAVKIVTL